MKLLSFGVTVNSPSDELMVEVNVSFSSFATEEMAWIETQNFQYRQVKLNLKASFFQDLILMTIGVKHFKSPFTKTCQSIMEKLVQFLISTYEYQTLDYNQKQRVLARNVPLATFFVGITAEWFQDGEAQFLFVKNLLTSFTGRVAHFLVFQFPVGKPEK